MSTRNNNFSNRNQKGEITVLAMDMAMEKESLDSQSLDSQSLDSKNSSHLASGYIAMIILLIIGFICSMVYIKRNYNTIRQKTINISRSFKDVV